jgi:hypothetical protein
VEGAARGTDGGIEILEHLLDLGGEIVLADDVSRRVVRDLACDQHDLAARDLGNLNSP